jgi:hypothetical protein
MAAMQLWKTSRRQAQQHLCTSMRKMKFFTSLKGVTFSIDGDVFNASVGSIVVISAGAHHAWRNRSNSPIRMSTFFSPGGVEELYPKLVGLSLEELSTVVEPFGSGIVGPPIGE